MSHIRGGKETNALCNLDVRNELLLSQLLRHLGILAWQFTARGVTEANGQNTHTHMKSKDERAHTCTHANTHTHTHTCTHAHTQTHTHTHTPTHAQTKTKALDFSLDARDAA